MQHTFWEMEIIPIFFENIGPLIKPKYLRLEKVAMTKFQLLGKQN